MIPWEEVDRAVVPAQPGRPGQGQEIESGAELILSRRGDEYAIRVDNRELMNSRSFGSEQVVASMACERLDGVAAPHVLIGGLGMGFTLRTTLDRLPAEAKVTVAELVPGVVDWNRQYLGELAGKPLEDPRVELFVGDAADIIRSHSSTFDAVVLDIDNGPHSKSSSTEGWLYSDSGLEAIHRCLRSRGVLSIWSAGPTEGFARRIRRRGFTVDEKRVRGRERKGDQYRIWLAQRNQ